MDIIKKIALTIFLAFTSLLMYGQSKQKAINGLEKQPILFIDSIQVDKSEMQKYNADQIASVSVVKDSVTLGIFGNTADAVIYVETKNFCRQRFVNYFASKSIEFKKLFESLGDDKSFQYFLNGYILNANYESNLAAINDNVFLSLTIIDQDELEKKHNGIIDKSYGILIMTDSPVDFFEGEK
ncbi:hypothetical protein [Sphingobacterium corticibacterium]|uniref:Uncharacterized protein n=1 Tax=Sphingobacterium corticibacterium TaxID=2484746 RepID=A0A4Q6XXS3_9SPHI|nr:hypothetical protein [Sphingobacterium corticibacterium]RZF62592.1 hypothetical protein EWE74_07300 [Sphingobacterium corticibacterium]